MTDEPGQDFSPYVGLRPYAQHHADYFFGREREARVVVANLFAARLTVLHGGTGVGKSSLLDAGVLTALHDTDEGVPVVFREWQGAGFFEALKRACAEAGRNGGDAGEPDADAPLAELLRGVSRSVGGRVLLLLDQFEEYFVAHPEPDGDGGFDAELARVVNQAGLDVGVLVSLREDALAGLGRFRHRIANMLGTAIEVRHLTPEAAERAIRGPLDVYNERFDAHVSIDDELVGALLADVQPKSPAANGGAGTIETPYLQLVLERLWQVERQQRSERLRLETYVRLGRADGIVGSHFSAILESLTKDELALCALFFDRLVTPSGGKIAYPVDDLTRLAGPLRPHVPATLEALGRARVLREVELPGRRAVELYHDVLAPKVLEWQAEILQRQERAARRRRLRRRLAIAALALLAVAAAVATWAYSSWVDRRAWATFGNLGTGQAARLSGEQVLVGRRTDVYRDAQISVSNNFVSRIHLIVYRDGRVLDIKSQNGTTVNAKLLEYGVSSPPLAPGDVVVLGGAAVFRFEPIEYPFWRLWTPAAPHRDPASGWALLVDGATRRTTPLTADRYWLTVRDGEVVAGEVPRPDAVAVAFRAANGLGFVDSADGKPIDGQCAQEGEPLKQIRLEDGATYDERVSSCPLSIGGARFQLVPLGQ